MNIKKRQHYERDTPVGRIILYLFLLYMFFITGCAPAMYDASFRGKVIDSETWEPIEGAVVLAIWTTWMMTPAGEVDKYYDCYEKLTDKNGDFFVAGKGPRVMSNLNPMTMNIIKVGYAGAGGTLEYYSRYQPEQSGRIIIPLKKLTHKQRKLGVRIGDPPDEAPLKKIKNFLIELDRYRIERGLPPRREWHGEVYL